MADEEAKGETWQDDLTPGYYIKNMAGGGMFKMPANSSEDQAIAACKSFALQMPNVDLCVLRVQLKFATKHKPAPQH